MFWWAKKNVLVNKDSYVNGRMACEMFHAIRYISLINSLNTPFYSGGVKALQLKNFFAYGQGYLSEDWIELPHVKAILEGLKECDLIEFHRMETDYCRRRNEYKVELLYRLGKKGFELVKSVRQDEKIDSLIIERMEMSNNVRPKRFYDT